MPFSHSLRAFGAAAVAAMLAAGSAPAQNAPTTSPSASAAAPARVVSVEGITEYRLANGLRVLLFPDKSKPRTTVNVTYLVGSRHEGYGETGMAHLLEHMLFKGSPKHRNPSEEITSHGASFDATTSFDRTNFFETFAAVDSNLVWALDLESDRMVNSFIAKADLDKEFSVVRNEYERGENDPFLVTLKRVLGTAYLFHAYGHLPIGSQSDIENVPIERLQAFYHKHYQPDNAVVMIAGNFDEQRTLALVQQKFGAIARPTRVLDQTYTVEPVQDGERTAAVRRSGDAQLVMAFYHVPSGRHPDFPAIDVLTRIMGDPASGRLFKALVEPKKAAVVQADNLQQHDPGGIFLAARVRREQSMDSAQAALLAAATEIASTKPPTTDEVERAKASALKLFELAPTNTGTFGLQLSEWMAMGDWRLFFYHRDQLKKVTLPDVQRVASTYFKLSNRTLGVFIPTDKPDRSEIAASPSADSVLRGYKGVEAVAAGEAFDPTPDNIEARVHRTTLRSGLRVAMLAKKNRGEAVNALITLRMGNEQSLTSHVTAATLTAQMLMRGTKSLTRQQLRDSLDHLKARVSVASAIGFTRMSIETTRPNLPATLRLAADMLRQPALDSTEFDQVQREALGQVEAQRGDPQAVALNTFNRQISRYPKGHARYVPTADEQVEMLKATHVADVRAFHSGFYGASHGELVIVGDFDEAAAARVAAEGFGDWKSPAPFKLVPLSLAATTAGKQSVETPDKANAFFLAGQTFTMQDTSADYAALLLANYMLGESALDSRLPGRIRGKEGLSYAVQSVLTIPTIDRSAQWLAVAIYNPLNAEKVTAAFLDEMGKVAKDGFAADEVEKSKTAYVQRRKLGRSNDAALAQQLDNALFLGRTMRFDDDLEKRIGSLTADQVNAAVRRTLDTNKMSIVLAGDFAKVQQAGKPQ